MTCKIIKIGLITFLLSPVACLKTRSDVSQQDQQEAYGKKNAENQMEAQATAVMPSTGVDEKDELIRNLNGRVEVLENELATLAKEKEAANSQDSQKITLLQEALTKLELQMQKYENESPVNKNTDTPLKSSDEAASEAASDTAKVSNKKIGAYEAAQQYFAKQDWKKAILSFQKYTDETPRGKNVADAKYKIGVCFQELGMKEEAMAFYEEVVANYAKTAAGKKSKERLGSIKK